MRLRSIGFWGWFGGEGWSKSGGSLLFLLGEGGGVVMVNRRKVFCCNLIVRNLGVARGRGGGGSDECFLLHLKIEWRFSFRSAIFRPLIFYFL